MGSDAAALVDRAAAIARTVPGLDAFEVRADLRDDRRFVLRNGALRAARTYAIDGVGCRAFVGAGAGYAYTNETTAEAVHAMIERAARLARANASRRWEAFPARLAGGARRSYAPDVKAHPHAAEPEAIVEFLRRAEGAAAEAAPGASVQVSFGARRGEVVRADANGGWTEVASLLSTLLVQVVAKEDGRIGDGTEWRGGERGLGDYDDRGGPEALGREAAAIAREQLRAENLPAGRYRTMCDNHLTGLLAHESFGHLTEYDLVAPGWSVLKGRLGETLARPEVTVRDAPVVPGAWRQGVAVPVDDEGTPGRDVALLEKGVLGAWMHARDSAASAGSAATGNGRALDVRHPPIVRMRNTYIEPGELTRDEAFEVLGDGVYLVGGRGGAPRCDGSFMFTSKRGYLVEGGRATKPLRMASIHGNVLDFLQRVEGLTRDFEVHTNFFGGCGKWDQSFLHVGTGGPHVVVSEALVGGQGA